MPLCLSPTHILSSTNISLSLYPPPPSLSSSTLISSSSHPCSPPLVPLNQHTQQKEKAEIVVSQGMFIGEGLEECLEAVVLRRAGGRRRAPRAARRPLASPRTPRARPATLALLIHAGVAWQPERLPAAPPAPRVGPAASLVRHCAARPQTRSQCRGSQCEPRDSTSKRWRRKGERTRNVPRLAQSSGSGSDGGVATQIVRHLLGVRGRHVEAVGAAVAHGLHQPVPVQRAPAERAGPAVDLAHHACGNSASRSGSQAAESSGSYSSSEQQNSERQQQ